MAYYPGGHQYYNNTNAPQQSSQPTDPYGHTSVYEHEDRGDYGTQQGGADNYRFAESRASVSARQTDELFIAEQQANASPVAHHHPSPPAGSYRTQYQNQHQNSYNPQSYNSPIQLPNPQAFGGVNRSFPPPVPAHAPYNPALYTEPSVTRHNTVSHPTYSYSGSQGSYPSPPQPSYPSPQVQSSQFGRSYSVQQNPRINPSHPTHSYDASHQQLQSPSVYANSGIPPPLPPHSAVTPSADWQNTHSPARPLANHTMHAHIPDYDTTPPRNPLPPPPGYSDYVSRQGSTAQRPNEFHQAPSYAVHNVPLAGAIRQSPQRRPLPPPPPVQDSDSDGDYFGNPNEATQSNQDDLFREIENQYNTATSNMGRPVASPKIEIAPATNGDGTSPTVARHQSTSGHNGTTTNGHLSPYVPNHGTFIESDESDIEAAAGLAAMQMADAQDEVDEARRRTGGSTLFGGYTYPAAYDPPQSASQLLEMPKHPQQEMGSDSDYVPGDIGLFGGSYQPHFSYGLDQNQTPIAGGHADTDTTNHTVATSGSLGRSEGESDGNGSYDYNPMDSIHPFPPFSTARVDAFGTGGLADPAAHGRRRSYDEGDETGFTDNSIPPPTSEPPEMFYHPGMSPHRPLPPPPPQDPQYQNSFSRQNTTSDRSYDDSLRSSYPSSAFSIATASSATTMTTPGGVLVPRSASLLNHSHNPLTIAPVRSKTDADQPPKIRLPVRTSTFNLVDTTGEVLTAPTTSAVALDLPTLPAGKRFNPSKLNASDFKKCAEPWALSSVISWLKSMAEGEADLYENTIIEGLVALFHAKVPTMNIADAETLSAHVVQAMYKAGTLVHEEEWLKFSSATVTGVLYQLTGSGCYASRLHTHGAGRCYSYHCQRTVKKIDLQAQPGLPQSEDWAVFYKLKKEDIEGVSPKEVERQNILHEVVIGEDKYIEKLDVLRLLYRDKLAEAQPPIIPSKKIKSFLRDVFGKAEAVKKANEDYLLPQLKYRQQEQGPWITGFSDIFREWIRKAKNAYIEYASAFPKATFLVRQEQDRNMMFRSFLDQARLNKMSNKLSWDSFLKEPITRLQHYGLLLNTVLKRSILDNEEKKNLMIAIEEIKQVTLECDTRVAEMGRKVDLTDLQSKLILRPGMVAELNLDHLGRELIFKGDLQRMGQTRFTLQETHALLFDHYLVLAKTITREVDGGTKTEKYDISKVPIPMDLLVLESTFEDPVVKSNLKGLAAAKTGGAPGNRVGPAASLSPGVLSHTNTSSSISSTGTASSSKTMTTTTVLEARDEKVMYPFRIKHLGKEVYTLFAPSAQNRADWCQKIIEAKTKHAAALFTQNAEPFRLRVMADCAFAYEGSNNSQKGITIKGTPLDRAVQEVEAIYSQTGRPPPICRAKVNCATAFWQPYGKQLVAVGTDFGVYISEIDNPRGWSKSISLVKVTQIAVLEEFGLFLLISDKSLIAYHLDAVCPVGGTHQPNDSSRRAPQKLSGARDIGFFATGKMKERTLVFYKKREGLSSTFKVLEPVFQKSTERKNRLFSRSGRTEFFRDFDEFYIPTECYGINLFHSSLAVSTQRGFEVLTLDKKKSWSVPDLQPPHVSTIASRIQNLYPLGMFRLSDQEFLLCYEECAVYVNKHGDISRSVIMEFVGRAKSAAMYGPYVLLFDPDFVEIRNAQNGRLRQVISGRDVKLLDNGLSGTSAGQRTIKICLQHPEQERSQIVVELLLNERVAE